MAVAEARFDYDTLADKVRTGLKDALSGALVATDEGYRGRVHAVVVWDRFDGMPDERRQAFVWEALKSKLEEQDLLGVSLVMTVAPRDLL
jgi:hypothetical protein